MSRLIQPNDGFGPVIRLVQTPSTNRYLKEQVEDLPAGGVCYTDDQSAGRGRLGRVWEAPPHTALALSVLWYPTADPTLLPLICGLAATRAIEDMVPVSAYIKWPNDSICNDRKVCGILCEGGNADGRPYVVAGIGINLTQTAADFEQAGLPHAASLYSLTGKTVASDDMAEALLRRLWEVYAAWEAGESVALLQDIRRRCITLGKEVRVMAAEPFTGMAVDVDESGRLLVDTPDGTRHAVNAGEVSVRGLYGYT